MTPSKPAPVDMLLPPAVIEDPSPLRVSTFAKPEYAKLTFVYGKAEDSSATWPVYCKSFTVYIPTGRQASALTSEPKLIRYELTVPEGKRQWNVQRDDRDPNQTAFTCSPPPGQPAVFDGTWQVQLQLWGIEVNGGAGPVDITWEESTSTNGSDFLKRTGRGEVSKRDDSFYLHSFRPASVAIGRATKAVLYWEGTSSATYTMYYRNPDGTQGSAPAKDGRWESPVALVDDSSFTLKAEMDGEIRYLTTYIKVNDPDIAVTNVTANGNVTIHEEKELRVGRIRGAGTFPSLQIQSHVQANSEDPGRTIAFHSKFTANAALTANGPLIARGTLDAKGQVTVDGALDAKGTLAVGGALNAKGTLTVGGTTTLNGATNTKSVTVDPGANGYLWLKTGRFDAAAGTNVNTYGALAAHGSASLVGSMSLLHYFRSVPGTRTFTANTSGLVFGVVHVRNEGGNGWIRITSGGATLAHAWWEHRGSATAVALVRKGQTFTLEFSREAARGHMDCHFRWLPFGVGAAQAVLEDAEPATAINDITQPPQAETEAGA
ncbi:hypothetical protein M1P56_17120 [Streptomyces sp. HU2014]|uniref:hypothetical protein n=1 Tax=Streptomyces sp. HU2014 TaxID=2939414 RepID=UPI00200FC4EE|nr:hypothetical protein [Streptomyces sp. HU2014]UQI45953.1 hypothetical protein M1P56_17120 [Streptomyces sp. HU2014]